MKKLILPMLLMILLLAACQGGGAPAPAAGGLKVLAIETFLQDIAQNVAGARLQVDALLPPGADPHAFEPAPRDIVRLSQAQLIIANGAGFESWMQKTLASAGAKATLLEAAAGLASRTAREGEVAVMSPAELADAFCAAAAQGPRPASAAAQASAAAPLPGGRGLFALELQPAADGSYGGVVQAVPAESGDYLAAWGTGRLELSAAEALTPEDSAPLACAGLASGAVFHLEGGRTYLLQLSGFSAARTSLLFTQAGDGHAHEGDPHFWLDPTKVVHYVETIRDGLSQADPAGAADYAANAAAYIARLNELDAWIQAQVAEIPAARRLLVTNHESFGYYADRYGFRVVGTIVPSLSTAASPSAQQLARLVDRIRAAGAPAVFLETGANPQLAQQLARETGVKVVTGLYTHSVTPAGGQAPTYIDMLKFNTLAIVQALK